MRFWHRSKTDFDREIESHLAFEIERLMATGMSGEDARDAARRAFGNVTSSREQFHERQRGTLAEQLMQDVRFAARGMRRTPGFAILSVLCLAIGISVNTSAFSVLNALLFRDYPGVREQDNIISLKIGFEAEWGRASPAYSSLAEYGMLRHSIPALGDLVAAGRAEVAVRGRDDPRAVRADFVSGNFFSALGTLPSRGRLLDARDDSTDASVAVVTPQFAERTFGAGVDALGQTITVNDRSFTVVGVAPPGFFGLVPDDLLNPERDGPAFWLPLGAGRSVRAGAVTSSTSDRWLWVSGRLQPGASREDVRAQASVFAARLAAQYPVERKNAFLEISKEKTKETIVGSLFVMAVPLLILFVACANLTNQSLARALQRSREIAVRLSLGATRARVIRQLLTEAALLALAASALAVLFSRWTLDALRAFFLSVPFRIPIDWRVLAFTVLIAMLTAAVFGLVPALRATRRDLVNGLKIGAGAADGRRSRLRSALVVAQVAASFALIALTGVFVRAAQHANHTGMGSVPQNLIAVELRLDLLSYDQQSGRAFQLAALDRLHELPGVEAVALAPFAPMARIPERLITIAGAEQGRTADVGDVEGAWFDANSTVPLRGRVFTPDEAAGQAGFAVVDEALVERLWNGANPIGTTARIEADAGEVLVTIIGVIATRPGSEGREPEGVMFVPGAYRYRRHTFLHVRTSGDPDAMREPIRAALRSIDPRLPLNAIRTAREIARADATPVRLLASGVGTLGGVALALAALGLFTVLSFTVAQRSREFGIRLALGAQRGGVTGMVLRNGLALAGLGMVIGGAAAAAVAVLMRAVLFGLPPLDPTAFGGATLLMFVVAAVACALPAWRASAVDPVVALKAD